MLFDTGISPDGMATNFERMELDASAIEAVVLSHGHPDHDGGFPGLARLRGRSGLPLAVHPLVFSRRRFALPNAPAMELPTLSRSALEAEGFEVIERRQPSLLLDGSVLITGEVDRTTEFEHCPIMRRGVTGAGNPTRCCSTSRRWWCMSGARDWWSSPAAVTPVR